MDMAVESGQLAGEACEVTSDKLVGFGSSVPAMSLGVVELPSELFRNELFGHIPAYNTAPPGPNPPVVSTLDSCHDLAEFAAKIKSEVAAKIKSEVAAKIKSEFGFGSSVPAMSLEGVVELPSELFRNELFGYIPAYNTAPPGPNPPVVSTLDSCHDLPEFAAKIKSEFGIGNLVHKLHPNYLL